MRLDIYTFEGDWEVVYKDGKLFHEHHYMEDEHYISLLREAGAMVNTTYVPIDLPLLQDHLREYGRLKIQTHEELGELVESLRLAELEQERENLEVQMEAARVALEAVNSRLNAIM